MESELHSGPSGRLTYTGEKCFMLQTKMGKIFTMALGVTLISWSMAFVFAAIAGETVNSAMEKVEAKTTNSTIVHEDIPLDLKGVETLEIEAGSQDVDVNSVDS